MKSWVTNAISLPHVPGGKGDSTGELGTVIGKKKKTFPTLKCRDA